VIIPRDAGTRSVCSVKEVHWRTKLRDSTTGNFWLGRVGLAGLPVALRFHSASELDTCLRILAASNALQDQMDAMEIGRR
jgi:hypothetical protein